MHSLETRSAQRQQAMRDEIADQIADFLAKGGKIELLQEPTFGQNRSALVEQDSDLPLDSFK